ncbi:response regulator [Brucella pseudogrignonensis]|uniref:response regulator n=1 Tax=Brucella pseudogrignonensis TaxID=419475 RepID=UPI0038D0F497
MIPCMPHHYSEDSSILIIEDDDLYCDGLSRHFEKLCGHVFHAASLGAALKACRDSNFSLVSIDLGLPDFGDSYESTSVRMRILESVVHATPSAQHIVITGRFSLAEAERCRSVGVKGYFSKRYLSAPVLAALLERMATGEFVIHIGNECATNATPVAYPFLNSSDEECLKWVECRPVNMKRVELFGLMARHFNFKSSAIAEQKYKRARKKLLRNMNSGALRSKG